MFCSFVLMYKLIRLYFIPKNIFESISVIFIYFKYFFNVYLIVSDSIVLYSCHCEEVIDFILIYGFFETFLKVVKILQKFHAMYSFNRKFHRNCTYKKSKLQNYNTVSK